ncbi:MAG: thioredoxin family protein [Pseudomonadota bacterium]
MHRRAFLISSAACLMPLGASAYPAIGFAPQTWRDLRETDQTVILNFRASWSLTCQIKAELIADLLAENPAYRALTFVDVDWDTFGPSQMTKRMNVTRRSTLVVMKGGDELARIENEPYAPKIRALLDTAIAA